MKILKNTLKIEVDTWSDPGDYPNALASGPLPSHSYVAGVDGEVVIELDDEDLSAYQECPEDFINDLDIPLPSRVLSMTLVVDKLEGNVMTLHVEDVEDDLDYGPDEPDCDYGYDYGWDGN